MLNPGPGFLPMKNGLRLGLGGAPLGNLFQPVSEAAAQAVLQAALADGCQTFDTAPHYGHGLSEHRFGQAFRHFADDHPGLPLAVSSKVGRLLTPDPSANQSANHNANHNANPSANPSASRDQFNFYNMLPFNQHWDYSASGVRQSVMDSLQRLGLARLDTVFVHDCCQVCHGANYPQVLQQVVTEALPELQRLKAQGLVGHIGIGVNGVQVCLDILRKAELDCILLAGRYTLIDHSALSELLPLCEARGVRVVIGGAFNSGILATGVKRNGHKTLFNYEQAPADWVHKVAAVETICDQFAVPLRAAALQFPLAHPCVDGVLAGAQTLAHWQDAVAMMAHPIPAKFWTALRDQRLIPAVAPTP